MDRISRDQLGIRTAELIAERGTCSRLKVGCAIFKDGRNIVSGYNGSPKGQPHCLHSDNAPCTEAIHAEANAIYFAAREGISLKDTKIYCTHQPCQKCAEAIIQAGIWKVIYLNVYRDKSGIETLLKANVLVYQINNAGNVFLLDLVDGSFQLRPNTD